MLEPALKTGLEAGFAAVEAFVEKSVRQESSGAEGPLSRHEARGQRLAVRAFRETGDPLGFVLSAPDARQVKRAFAEIAAASAVDRRRGFAHLLPRSAPRCRLNIYDAGIEAWDEEQAADLRERLRECLVSFPGLRLKRFQLSRELKKVYLANTRGFEAKYKKTLFRVQAWFQSRDHQLALAESRTHFRNFDPQRLAARGANLLAALGADPEPLEAGLEHVVMSPEASAQLLKEFAPWLKLDRPGPRERAVAASSRVSILDNPALDEQPGSVPFDDEGTPAAETCLLNKGVAAVAASDIRTAFEKGGVSSGNGFRDEGGAFPAVRFTNLFFRPSNFALARLLERAANGVLVYLAKRQGPGRLPGETCFVAHGYRFAGGEVTRPIQFRLAFSMRSYLLHVAEVSRELRFFHSRANVGSPYLLLQGRRDGSGSLRV